MERYSGKHVLILGAARQGLAVARYLHQHGAIVTMNDARSQDQMRSAVASLAGLNIRWHFGGHPVELLQGTDVLVLSGAIPHTLPIVVAARERGIHLTNDTEIFLDVVPCPWVGITGSAGKTTTTTLVGRMAEAGKAAGQRVWVGGNIGLPLLSALKDMRKTDLVILELSSFQLELTTHSPNVGAILNITPNHLDRHGSMSVYTAAKLNMLAYQQASDIAVLNHQDPILWHAAPEVKGKLLSFGFDRNETGNDQVYLKKDRIVAEFGGTTKPLLQTSQIKLRGRHNTGNVIAACAVALASGFDPQAMAAGVADFHGVPHRLELVRVVNGVSWYNDSICTAPERVIAAIQSFEEPIVLLLGGRDKNLPWDNLANLVHQRVKHVILFGEAAPIINAALAKPQAATQLKSVGTSQQLKGALEQAHKLAEAGDVVLLSPGGTSFDEFYDFEERGKVFRAWVEELK